MKTYNGKNISKKYIQDILRTEDPTQIFRLCHKVCGDTKRSTVYDFFREYAPTVKLYKKAYDIVYGCKRQERAMTDEERTKAVEFFYANNKHIVVNRLREEIARGLDNYTKVPMMSGRYLHFVSPVYRLADYNAWRAIAVKGNERFCEVVCEVVKKHFPEAY